MNEETFPRIEIGAWVDRGLDWLTDNLDAFFDALSEGMGWIIQLLVDILLAPPAMVTIAVFALLAWFIRSWQLAVGTLLSFALIASMRQWENAMLTLALVLVATVVAVAIAVPIGIAAARSDRVSTVVKP